MAVKARLLPDRYRDPELVGRGGMGEIYRAKDEILGRTVAIKLLSEQYAGDPSVRERFTREALAAARLSGRSNIVTIFDVGECEGAPYIVMEYLGGGTLADHVRDGPIPVGQALEWLRQAASALDDAHAEGVVHRDVKPANLLLDETDHVHVADFGIANAAGMDSLTRTGTVLGTASYLSPEQARGERATAASDRYALAVVAWELLTGTRPFGGDTIAAEAAAHAYGEIPSVSEARPDLPRGLDDVFHVALAKDPSERYPSSAELVAAIAGALHDGAHRTAVLPQTPATPPPRAHPSAPRRRPGWLLPATLVLVLLGAGLLAAALVARGDETSGTTVVRTVTADGETQSVTVTAEPEATAPAPTAEPPSEPPSEPGLSVAQARALQDESTAALHASDWERALALAQQALPALQGRDVTYEGYANYNIGRALAELDRCEEALPYLERRRELGGPHPDVDRTIARCRGG